MELLPDMGLMSDKYGSTAHVTARERKKSQYLQNMNIKLNYCSINNNFSHKKEQFLLIKASQLGIPKTKNVKFIIDGLRYLQHEGGERKEKQAEDKSLTLGMFRIFLDLGFTTAFTAAEGTAPDQAKEGHTYNKQQSYDDTGHEPAKLLHQLQIKS